MTIAAIREQLHQYIDTADDRKIKALLTLLEDDMTPTGISLSAAEIDLLHQRAINCADGTSTTYSIEEARELIRKSVR